jgi:hypothetical protein
LSTSVMDDDDPPPAKSQPMPNKFWTATAAGTAVLDQDLITCYTTSGVTAAFDSKGMPSGTCTCCQDHPGTARYLCDLRMRHSEYVRARNNNERVLLCRELFYSVGTRQGRFWIHAPGAETLRLMDAVEIEKRLLSDLTQRCLVSDVCKDKDILLGRGARCTNDAGHQRFLDQKDVLRPAYKAASSNDEKTRVAQKLVDWVYANGGRILQELESDQEGCHSNQWYVVDSAAAVKKAKEKLREARKAKHAVAATIAIAASSATAAKAPTTKIRKSTVANCKCQVNS